MTTPPTSVGTPKYGQALLEERKGVENLRELGMWDFKGGTLYSPGDPVLTR
jgi:hypothetical protein